MSEAKSSFDHSISGADIEGHSHERQALGDTFTHIYTFPFHRAFETTFAAVKETVDYMIDAKTDGVYRRMLADSVETALFHKFNGLTYHTMSANILETNGIDDPANNIWITTQEALKASKFSFNPDKTIASPPQI
ncbi:MAG: hypothetical protein HRT94_09385 [Alphaproteobacteria bacterium]|nr:hypothetical protein [Alphaproteobacteria bacterium]